MSVTWDGTSANINVPELTEKIRIEAQDIQGLAQLATPPTGRNLGLGSGDRGDYVYVPDVPTQGGELDENEPFPSTTVDPIKTYFTMTEYGNSIAYTGKLDDLTRLDMDDVHMQSLNNDRKKLENTQVYNQLTATDWKACFIAAGDEFKKTGAVVGTIDQHLSLDNLRWLRTRAKTNRIPFWDGESYLYVTGADEINELESDSDLTTLLRYDSGRAALNGEFGRIAQCRVIEDNHLIATIATSFQEGFLVGADAVVQEEGLPWEMRFEIADLGRDKRLGYYGIMAWFKVLDQTTHSQEHIIHVTTA